MSTPIVTLDSCICPNLSIGIERRIIPGLEDAATALSLFLTIDPEEQARRILRRNGPIPLQRFLEERIPMEHRYFSEFIQDPGAVRPGPAVTVGGAVGESTSRRLAGIVQLPDSVMMPFWSRYASCSAFRFASCTSPAQTSEPQIRCQRRMNTRIFIQFIALILLSQVQKTLRERKLSDRFSPRLIVGELESLTRIYYAGKCDDVTSEASKVQREILEAFAIDPNTLKFLWISGLIPPIMTFPTASTASSISSGIMWM
jgi:hypothetical protein